MLPLSGLVLALLLFQNPPLFPPEPQGNSDAPKLPNGRNQKDEILKEEYRKSLEDVRSLIRLSDELKIEIEKDDRFVVSLNAIRKTEEIEKLARRIRGRMKRF